MRRTASISIEAAPAPRFFITSVSNLASARWSANRLPVKGIGISTVVRQSALSRFRTAFTQLMHVIAEDLSDSLDIIEDSHRAAVAVRCKSPNRFPCWPLRDGPDLPPSYTAHECMSYGVDHTHSSSTQALIPARTCSKVGLSRNSYRKRRTGCYRDGCTASRSSEQRNRSDVIGLDVVACARTGPRHPLFLRLAR
jgi:hypothetical protein